MPDDTSTGGQVNISDISGGEFNIEGGLFTTGDVAGDVVGRDKIVHNTTQIIQQVLSAAEEAAKAQDIARQRLAEGVQAYVQRIGDIAADDQDALQGGPYRGLKAYTLREAEIFFGRDEAMAALLSHLQRGRLTILHAESGAGKSSLLQAGIQYQLIVQGHVPLYIRPYDKSPAQAIKQTLLPGLDRLPALATASLRDYLHQVTAVLGSRTIVVILIDQFEELFFNLTEEERQTFVGELATCLEDESLTVRWVLALRTEFFGNLANFRPRIKNPFENDFRLNRLPADKARVVIEEPARRVGITYEPNLIDTLLNDLRDPDNGEVAPAQLQLVCLALYNLLPEPQRVPDTPATITLAMYDAEGRTEGILRGYLQRVLRNELRPQERELARQLLIALVSSDQRRIRRTKSELAATLSTYLTAAQSLDGILEQLVDSRLLSVNEDEQTDELSYELSHDLLLRQIEIDPETQARKAAEELLKQEVEAFKRHETLLDPKKFDIINSQWEFLVLDDTAQELLQASQEAIEAEERKKEQQRRQRNQIVFGFGVVASILAVVAGIFFFQAQIEADNALNAEGTAVSAGGIAIAEAERANSETENALNAEGTAVAEATRANIEAEKARQAEQTAQTEAQAAQTAQQDAERQSLIARAGQLAALAQTELDNKNIDQALMLAREAVLTTWLTNTEIITNPFVTLQADAALRQAVAQAEQRPWRTTMPWRAGHTDWVRSVAFSPDGSRIVSGSSDQTLRLWFGSPGGLLPVADALIQRDPAIFIGNERARFGFDGPSLHEQNRGDPAELTALRLEWLARRTALTATQVVTTTGGN